MHDNTAEELHKCVCTIFKIRLYITLALFVHILSYECLLGRLTHIQGRMYAMQVKGPLVQSFV